MCGGFTPCLGWCLFLVRLCSIVFGELMGGGVGVGGGFKCAVLISVVLKVAA